MGLDQLIDDFEPGTEIWIKGFKDNDSCSFISLVVEYERQKELIIRDGDTIRVIAYGQDRIYRDGDCYRLGEHQKPFHQVTHRKEGNKTYEFYDGKLREHSL